QVHGEQGRGTRGVDGEAGPAQVQEVRDAVGDRPVRRGGAGQLTVCPAGRGELTVRAVHGADEDAGVRITRVLAEIARLLQQVPRGLQEQPFLRVDVLRVPWEDPEEPRVELVDAVEETAPATVGALRPALFRVEVGAPVPAVRGYLGHTGPPGGQHPPGPVAGGRAGVPAHHTPDRYLPVPYRRPGGTAPPRRA